MNIKRRLAVFNSERHVICISITYLNIRLPRVLRNLNSRPGTVVSLSLSLSLSDSTRVSLLLIKIQSRKLIIINAKFALRITANVVTARYYCFYYPISFDFPEMRNLTSSKIERKKPRHARSGRH